MRAMRTVTPEQKRLLDQLIDRAVEARVKLDLIAVEISNEIGCSVGDACESVLDCVNAQDLLSRFNITVARETNNTQGR